MRHTIRRLFRARAFAVTAILTLTLGIGGAAAVFTVVNGVLLRPLPYDHSEQVVDISHTLEISGISRVDQSDATYLLYRSDNQVFTDFGAYRATAVNLGGLAGSVDASTAAQRMPAALATSGVFNVLGIKPARGRMITDDDARPGAPPVVVIGARLWENAYGADPQIVGKRVSIDGVDRTIVGVAPASFHFPSFETAMWLPLEIDPSHTRSAAFDYRGIARLRPGTNVAGAAVNLASILPRVPVVYPGRMSVASIAAIKMRPSVRPLRDVVVGDIGAVLWVVLGAVGVLLLIACANVANLFLARAEGRQREIAVRRALGADRGRLIADVLSEAAVVASIGGALGLVCAALGVRALQSIGTGATIPRLAEVGVDGAVLAATAGIVILAMLVVGIMPIARTETTSLSEMLMASGRSGAGRMRHRARRALVVTQVALALILLASAGLLARSFARLRAVDPGFTTEHTLAVRMTLPVAGYPNSGAAARAVFRMLDAIAAIPGARTAGVATKLPLDAEASQDSAVWVEDKLVSMSSNIPPNIHPIVFATPGYFSAMGVSLVSGRMFDAPDPGGAPSAGVPEVIVSEAFAHRYWDNASPIGKRVRMNPTDPWHTIVGVVRSVRDQGLEQPLAETVYCPLVTISAMGTPHTPRDLALVVRTTGDPMTLAPSVRRVVHDLDPALPLYRVIATSELVAEASARTTFTLFVLGVAGIVALTLGAVGIYGVISYLVSLRTREIGVRLALGATPANMRRFVTRQALVDATAGVVVGVAGAAGVTRVLHAVLFDVSPTDPITLAAASAALILTAVAASWLPARRAASLDPASTLRSE